MGRYVAGRALEVAGMAGVLVGLLIGVSHRDLIRVELIYCAIGVAVFYLGYFLERGVRR